MKKFSFILMILNSVSALSAMVRAGVDVGPDPAYNEDNYYGWYGPGVYYGVYYDNYPAYYAWQNQYYYGGPYYWRNQHYHGHDHGHWHGGDHGHSHGGHH